MWSSEIVGSMRWLAAIGTICGACAHPGLVFPATAGEASPRAAVMAFISAAERRDFRALGVVWGTSEWLVRDKFSGEFERRAVIVGCYLSGRQFRAVRELPDVAHGWTVVIESAQEPPETVPVRVVRTSSGRWVVESLDLSKLRPPQRCDL